MLKWSIVTRPPRTLGRLAAAALALILLGNLSALPAEGGGIRSAPAPTAPTTPGEVIDLLPLQTADRRIVDTAGRDVLLRGANVNSLGEYWQGVPTIEPTIPLTDADWELMASRGFSVVRLLITWSRVEPVRDVIDESYLDEVEAAVDEAADRGIYTVIDMHQDAYSAFISTSDPATCPPGTSPAKGWDGAPAWATRTDGLSTCLPSGGERNSSPAVNRAWNNFYDNVDGIRDEFAEAWAAIATRFAGRSEVAGFDLLNEPENPRPAAEMQPVYNAFLADVIGAVRAAEAAAAAPFDHIVFVEPALPAGDQSRGLVIPDPAALGGDVSNISASVHNYAESIGDLGTIEGMNDLIEAFTASIGVPNWGGEYGFWSLEPATLEKARRYAADEDDHLWGGAWWQWRQSCGDPHAVYWSGSQVVAPTGPSIHLNLLECPHNGDLGPNDAFGDILGRGYPRAAPGRLTEVRSDIDTGWLKVKADTVRAGGELVVWTPTADGPDHRVHTVGLRDLVEHDVAGGRLITAVVEDPGLYALWIGEPDEDLSTTTTTTTIGSAPTTLAPTTSEGGAIPPRPAATSPTFTG